MSSRWWRAYETAVDDPKLQQLPLDLFRAWFNLLCLASGFRGILPPISIVAFKLRLTEVKAAELITRLVMAGLIDQKPDGSFEPHNWNRRQFVTVDVTPAKDPDAAIRSQRYRDRKRDATVTRTVTRTVTADVTQTENDRDENRVAASLPETETDSETEREKEAQQPIEQNNQQRAVAKATRAEHPSFAEFWKVYPRRTGRNPRLPAAVKFTAHVKSGFDPAAIIGGAERYAEECRKDTSLGTKFVATAIVWLNQCSWQDYPELAGSLVAFKRPDDAPPEDPRWVEVKAKLAKLIGADKAASWLDPLEFEGIDGGGVKLCAPSLFHRNHVIQHYGDAIFEAWQAIEPDALKLLIGNKKAAA